MSSTNQYNWLTAINSIKKGDIGPLKSLLTLPGLKNKFDPSQQNNLLLILAIQYNNIDAVKLLLLDGRINPTIPSDSKGFRDAVKYGFTQIVNILLEDNRINPSSQKNYAIRIASENGFTNIVKLLLKNPNINPSDQEQFCLFKAIIHNNMACVKLLLAHPLVDPTIRQFAALKLAMKKNHKEIIFLLLSHPSARDIDTCLYTCAMDNFNDVQPQKKTYKHENNNKIMDKYDTISKSHSDTNDIKPKPLLKDNPKNIMANAENKNISDGLYAELSSVLNKYINNIHSIEYYDGSPLKTIIIKM